MKIQSIITTLKAAIEAVSSVTQVLVSPIPDKEAFPRVHDNISYPAVFLWDSGWVTDLDEHPDSRIYSLSLFTMVVSETDIFGESGYEELREVEFAIEEAIRKYGPENGVRIQAYSGDGNEVRKMPNQWVYGRRMVYIVSGVEVA